MLIFLMVCAVAALILICVMLIKFDVYLENLMIREDEKYEMLQKHLNDISITLSILQRNQQIQETEWKDGWER